MKASELFWKYPKIPVFDHSNYWLFERIPAVPGTSNNRGLTVYQSLYPKNSQVLIDVVLSKKRFLNQTPSCICLICLHCIGKVSNCSIKSCCRSWSAHERTIYAVPSFNGKTQITGKTTKIPERPKNNTEILIGASAKTLINDIIKSICCL